MSDSSIKLSPSDQYSNDDPFHKLASLNDIEMEQFKVEESPRVEIERTETWDPVTAFQNYTDIIEKEE